MRQGMTRTTGSLSQESGKAVIRKALSLCPLVPRVADKIRFAPILPARCSAEDLFRIPWLVAMGDSCRRCGWSEFYAVCPGSGYL